MARHTSPQGKRTPAESAAFKHMLANVNLLYLGCYVLVLLDLSYMSRFWTQFEAWLSLQAISPDLASPRLTSPHLASPRLITPDLAWRGSRCR